MHAPRLLGAAAAAVVAVLLAERHRAAPLSAPRAAGDRPARADGHYVLVVEGDRDGLDVTFASKKDAPWAGAPKGFSSAWRLEVLDAAGAALAAVPLDVRPFATHAGAKGKPAVVRGCVVVDSKIGMLVSAPRYAQAARYRFSRADAAGVVTPLGEVPASEVRELAGDAR
ncbi:MAG: hypothetical protein VYA51_06730 [Planctomycetota bacterium]|nr:hypothetical protein [Planctomycetota bacterium]